MVWDKRVLPNILQCTFVDYSSSFFFTHVPAMAPSIHLDLNEDHGRRKGREELSMTPDIAEKRRGREAKKISPAVIPYREDLPLTLSRLSDMRTHTSTVAVGHKPRILRGRAHLAKEFKNLSDSPVPLRRKKCRRYPLSLFSSFLFKAPFGTEGGRKEGRALSPAHARSKHARTRKEERGKCILPSCFFSIEKMP